jgi:hypothetical protein
MRVRHLTWTSDAGWSAPLGPDEAGAHLVLSFGPEQAPPDAWFGELATHCPTAQHVYVSGGGQIVDSLVEDALTVVTFLQFDRATVHPILLEGATVSGSQQLGADLGGQLRDIAGLRHVLVFAEGITFNGAAFLSGLNPMLPEGVRVSGGMASNGTDLTNSVIGLNGPPSTGRVVAIGLAGDSLVIGTGSVGGWDFFGPERMVTRADITVLHELDGERALDVYKRYLGAFADELPGSALLFPLAVRATRDGPVAVRTCLSVDEAEGTLRFAGDIPMGAVVRLMRTTPDKLADGAARAALLARADAPHGDGRQSLTLCVSCIGRRAVMRSRVEEELEEVVRESQSSVVVGFYSNGEIAPPSDGRDFGEAVLHNQTMTITTITEL